VTAAQLTTRDGHTLTGDLALPPPGTSPAGAVVVCHPHPQYGGNRFDAVVTALYDALPAAGFAALRFDFRSGFEGGVGERLDVVAALDHLDTVAALAGVPRAVAGYSFGAVVALTTDDDRIAAVAAIAPPLAVMGATDPGVPTLVLTPRHDQFSPPDATEPLVRAWVDAQHAVVESADHFLAGHALSVAGRVTAWLAARR
jgi:alpha/beta superfamily hydrolase